MCLKKGACLLIASNYLAGGVTAFAASDSGEALPRDTVTPPIDVGAQNILLGQWDFQGFGGGGDIRTILRQPSSLRTSGAQASRVVRYDTRDQLMADVPSELF